MASLIQNQFDSRREALKALRRLMREHEPALTALLIPSADAHLSEYVAARDCRREFISGFSGSAGDALVLQHDALIWVDGRYHTQADQQVDRQEWTVMKSGLPGVPTLEEWIVSQWPSGGHLGIDPTLVSKHLADALTAKLAQRGGLLTCTAQNLVDLTWTQRPPETTAPIMIQGLEYAGRSVADKLALLRDQLDALQAFAVVVAALDEIAWTLNVRGWDVQFNPVITSYLVVTRSSAFWYIDDAVRLSGPQAAALHAHLQHNAVQLRPYAAIFADLAAVDSCLFADLPAAEAGAGDIGIVVDPRSSVALFRSVASRPATKAVAEGSLIALPKAVKNAVEIEGMRQAHLRDGAALVEFLGWLDEELRRGDRVWTEYTASMELAKVRSGKDKFVSLSFDTICGCGPNGAIIHFKPDENNAKPITTDQLLLIDSGAQFRDGTTDVTRTVFYRSIGAAGPSSYERLCFTRVLQGHIALASAVFPKGTTGFQLDILARLPLWSSGLEYRHGTGHGVGSFLNVHEGPHGISPRIGSHSVPLQEGMVVTNEPGFYDVGKFGIRIESVLVVRKAETPYRWDGIEYLCFETITMAPLQVDLIDFELLNQTERDWVTQYNNLVVKNLDSFLDEKTKIWLRQHIHQH